MSHMIWVVWYESYHAWYCTSFVWQALLRLNSFFRSDQRSTRTAITKPGTLKKVVVEIFFVADQKFIYQYRLLLSGALEIRFKNLLAKKSWFLELPAQDHRLFAELTSTSFQTIESFFTLFMTLEVSLFTHIRLIQTHYYGFPAPESIMWHINTPMDKNVSGVFGWSKNIFIRTHFRL